MRLKHYVIGAAFLLASVGPVWPQSGNTAALVNSFIGVGETGMSTLSSLAVQLQALELQREQAQQIENQRTFQRDQAAVQSHHCQLGYTGALMVHADGT